MAKRVRIFIFFFQAEDGIRDGRVTGVQTCALPICRKAADVQTAAAPPPVQPAAAAGAPTPGAGTTTRATATTTGTTATASRVRRRPEIGRASCRERV